MLAVYVQLVGESFPPTCRPNRTPAQTSAVIVGLCCRNVPDCHIFIHDFQNGVDLFSHDYCPPITPLDCQLFAGEVVPCPTDQLDLFIDVLAAGLRLALGDRIRIPRLAFFLFRPSTVSSHRVSDFWLVFQKSIRPNICGCGHCRSSGYLPRKLDVG